LERKKPASQSAPCSTIANHYPEPGFTFGNYLAVGLLVGPTVLNLFHFNPLKESALLEGLTEIAVLISLFAAGDKMPVPFSFARWLALLPDVCHTTWTA
jgi:hypothetical protein